MNSTAATADRRQEAPSDAISGWAILWREHRIFLGLIAAHFLAGLLVDLSGRADVIRPGAWRPSIFRHFLQFALLGGAFAFVWYRLQVRDCDGRRVSGLPGWLAAAARFRRESLTLPRLGGVFIVAVGVAASTAVHDGWKGAIAQLHEYTWDETLIDWDRTLHFGADPWRILHPFLSSTELTWTLDLLYWLWYAVLIVGVMWQAWSHDSYSRRQFLIAYMLIWIVLGTIVAHLMPSVGPCFLERLTGNSTFEPLMSYLREVDSQQPLVALELQDTLWRSYRDGVRDHWMAISAMPSLHLAVPTLLALAGGRAHRWLGIAFWTYTIIVLVGSVHLGWHYAVDGYMGVAGGIACWWIAGRLGNVPAEATAA